MDGEIEGLKALYGDTEVELVSSHENQHSLKIHVQLCPLEKPVTFEFQLCEPFHDPPHQANICSPQGNEDILNGFLKEKMKACCPESASFSFFQIIEEVRNEWISFCRKPPAMQREPVVNVLPSPPVPQVIHSNSFTGNIFSGDVIVDRKSVFQAHVASVSSYEEVQKFLKTLLGKPKVAKATHNIMAYRVMLTGSMTVCLKKKKLSLKEKKEKKEAMMVVQDHDSDGEKAAGGRLSSLLQILDLKNVIVVVSRWYGGVPLGPQRFRHINNCARSTLEKAGFLSKS